VPSDETLSGEPLEEPLVHSAPFVMNSVDEINQAIEDLNAGRFGEARRLGQQRRMQ